MNPAKNVYVLIDNNTIDENWNGSPLVLGQYNNANMPQTTNGSLILSYINESKQNNFGKLSLTSGGGDPTFLEAQPLTTTPGMLIKNFEANNLSLTNISPNSNTPIRIQAVAPGIPGTHPDPLPIGQTVNLKPAHTLQGPTNPKYMQLVMRCNSGLKAIFAIIGGPNNEEGENGYAIIVNDSENTGPNGPAPPAGFYATTTSNAYTFEFNWDGAQIFLANMSSILVVDCQVTLIQL